MNKKEREAKELRRKEAIAFLKSYIKQGDTIYTSLRHVSSSGMMRHISVLIPTTRHNRPDIFNITGWVADVLDYKRADNGGLKVGGGGMDMGYQVVYGLSRTLFADDFACIGEGCPSNDHTNGEKIEIGKQHSDSGYALRHQWI